MAIGDRQGDGHKASVDQIRSRGNLTANHRYTEHRRPCTNSAVSAPATCSRPLWGRPERPLQSAARGDIPSSGDGSAGCPLSGKQSQWIGSCSNYCNTALTDGGRTSQTKRPSATAAGPGASYPEVKDIPAGRHCPSDVSRRVIPSRRATIRLRQRADRPSMRARSSVSVLLSAVPRLIVRPARQTTI